MKTELDYKQRSKKWDQLAGVRTHLETYELSLNSIKHEDKSALSWHLPTYSGILEHNELRNLSKEKIEYIKGIQLLEFVLKQTIFEIECVNKVASKLAHNKYQFSLRSELKLDALKIYTDEGYHAYYTLKVAQQIASHYGLHENELKSYIDNYYQKIDKTINEYGSEYTDLCLLAFVIAGESQIVSDISEQMRGVVYEPIREMFRNHMKDEVFHAKFFTQVFNEIWPQLTDNQKECMGFAFCNSLSLLSLPRTDVYYYSLSKFGYSQQEITNFIDEIYNTEEWKSIRVRDRMLPVIELLRLNQVFDIEEVKKSFENKKYI